ncbi:hypothetical protein E2C01_097541 [Portunus trituberculatus]|uniref:Uncharacterized protein n=1 Tax=Portunus trituberculatus TaxID=210409 RepID=A0A5B7K5X4_PORTR|nr:hypothetical protein [Portunus trituberculatus]
MVQRLVGPPPPRSLLHQEIQVQSGRCTERLLHSVMLALLTSLLYAPRYRSSYPALIMIFIHVASPHLVSPPYILTNSCYCITPSSHSTSPSSLPFPLTLFSFPMV